MAFTSDLTSIAASEVRGVQARRREKYILLAKKIAQRDISGMPPIRDFCATQKITQSTLYKVRSFVAYQEAYKSLTNKQVKILGESFREYTVQTKEKLRVYSDEAPKVLYEIMMDEAAPKPSRIDAAREIMDRDGRFAKVSRLMNVKEGADGAPMLPEDAAAEMLDALTKAGIAKVQ